MTLAMRSFVLLAFFVPNLVFAAEPLRYHWKPNQQFAYQIDITADLPGKIETLTGRINYTVKSAGEPLRLTYRGGLLKTSKDKEGQTSSRGPFGPFGPGFRPPIPPSPFGRSSNPLKGLEQTSNEMSMTNRGQVLTLEGSSQLPYLLGNLSLLVFESLPDTDQKTWKVESGVTITEGGGQSRAPFGPRFDPFDRFGNSRPEKSTGGSQSTSFTVEGQEGKIVKTRKTYQLESPGDQEKVTINGSGSWLFNTELGIPESSDFTQKVVSEEQNTTVTIPVTVKFRRLTDEEMAKIEAERVAAAAKAKEEHDKRLAEQAETKKALAQPLAGDKKQQLLTQLNSGNTARIVGALNELANRSPSDPDPEIVAAIRPLVSHANRAVKSAAERAMAQWSPDFKRKSDINQSYQGPHFVQPPNKPITADTQLFVGQIIVVNDSGAWYPAEITGLVPTGEVEVSFRGWGNRKKTVSRSNVQLAPDEVDQPSLAPTELAALRMGTVARVRTWTDVTGKFQVKAEFIRLDGSTVILKRAEDGQELKVPFAKLAAADQAAAQQLAKRASDDENPFKP